MKFWEFFFKVAQSNTHYGFQILFTHIRRSVGCIAVSVCVCERFYGEGEERMRVRMTQKH